MELDLVNVEAIRCHVVTQLHDLGMLHSADLLLR